jgi:hypothetical protein
MKTILAVVALLACACGPEVAEDFDGGTYPVKITPSWCAVSQTPCINANVCVEVRPVDGGYVEIYEPAGKPCKGGTCDGEGRCK